MAKHLSSVPAFQRADKRVTWDAAMKPVAQPQRVGTVFLSKGVSTMVRWDGDERLSQIATRALVVV